MSPFLHPLPREQISDALLSEKEVADIDPGNDELYDGYSMDMEWVEKLVNVPGYDLPAQVLPTPLLMVEHGAFCSMLIGAMIGCFICTLPLCCWPFLPAFVQVGHESPGGLLLN